MSELEYDMSESMSTINTSRNFIRGADAKSYTRGTMSISTRHRTDANNFITGTLCQFDQLHKLIIITFNPPRLMEKFRTTINIML